MRVNGLTPQDLKAYGIHDVRSGLQPDYDTLYQEELNPALEGYERGVLTNTGAIAVDTGILPVVRRKISISSEMTPPAIRCGGLIRAKVRTITNRSPGNRQHLKGLVTHQLSGKRLFIIDAFCGANADTRLSVRFITEVAAGAFCEEHVHSSNR